MHKFFSVAALAAVTMLLAGCGGSAFQGTSTGTGTGTSTAAAVALSSSATTIPDNGSASATISAVATDSSGKPASGVTVTFTASGGATIATLQGTTDSTGTAKATLTNGTAAAGTAITVTGTAGTVAGTTAVTVTASLKTMTVSSSTPTVPADGSAMATISAVATDSTGKAMSGLTVVFTASAGTIATTQATTDSTGTAKATLAAGTATVGTSITVTATSGAISGTATVAVAVGQQSVSMQTSSPQITSDGTSTALITAFVKDGNNNFVPGVVVNFTSTSGGLTVNTPAGITGATPGMTNASGAATATLSVAGDPTNRAITVTGTLGTTKSNIVVNVVGTTLNLAGPLNLVQGAQGSYSITLTDAGKNPIVGKIVTLTSSLKNTLTVNGATVSTVTTDSTGHAAFMLTAVNSGTDTLSAATLGLSSSVGVVVSNQSFSFTAPTANALIPLGTTVPVTVKWLSSGAPVPNQTITFAATRGTLSAATATTDANGIATVTITASSGGPANISASGTGVSATLAVSFVATNPTQIDLQAAPNTVPIKGQSTLTAIVRDPAGNLVQNANVTFTLTDTTGGALSFASSTTDNEVVATTVYTAGNTASATNGVSVLATVQGTSPAVTKNVTLTVDGAPLHVVIGTGQKIQENTDKTAFLMPWFVQLLDAAGHSVPNTQVNLTIHSASRPYYAYYKGSYEVCNNAWQQYDGTPGCSTSTNGSASIPLSPPTACLNEDVNLTGVYDSVEDINHNGVLDPGDVASVTTPTPGILTTGSDGTATFTVVYPEDHALWVQVTLTATATVSGTEASSSSTFLLPMLATYLTTTTSQPPGFVSPYGVNPSCSVAN